MSIYSLVFLNGNPDFDVHTHLLFSAVHHSIDLCIFYFSIFVYFVYLCIFHFSSNQCIFVAVCQL